ncbi:uncharacterized protein [Henckelia pumila]|uniref:uncharacterized protein n=1 Tax=Henckelia pumila TaxID=405737 RepID=UPI003C6E3CC0
MGELASFWGYTHDMDELGQELLWTTLELETLKSEAEAEIRKNKVYVENLIHLLKQAIQERDEARDQLQNLVNKTIDRENSSTLSHESPLDTVSSPEFTNIHSFLDQSTVQDAKNIDQGSMIIDSIAKGRASLPPKGKFLHAVLEAGPLLGTLLVAGTLPSLQNPPAFEVPLVSSKWPDGVFTSSVGGSGRSRCSPMACGTSVVSSSMLHFTQVPAVSCLSSSINTLVPLAKRQRFC